MVALHQPFRAANGADYPQFVFSRSGAILEEADFEGFWA
jgi:hypothetical protein